MGCWLSMTALELIKSIEQYESLILVIDDLDAQKVMAAWQIYHPPFKDRPIRKGETASDIWLSLWNSIEPIQFKLVSDDSGVPFASVCVLFRRLQNAHLIYPDGTISPNAKKLLTTAVGSNIAGMVPRGWKTSGANGTGKSTPVTPSTPSDTPSLSTTLTKAKGRKP
jgi:hypothetical protein